MNLECKKLGPQSSDFVDPNLLSALGITTALDLDLDLDLANISPRVIRGQF
ncbi:hypothetical protein SAMN02745753_04670 [Marinomonas polaris DSM 16579]|uniref:Uncharacterized protein n=1 Tax=Marinomonas polaris DSM 16579 TaxID=1122206 RepID=A0A1M5NJI0_9GAMM|nr:hypothetical protein [Marinomonas polaris]SHG89668.1 hypothetical protein SAMN02745753_04670 [Marinomonas polaris DSM 16579]